MRLLHGLARIARWGWKGTSRGFSAAGRGLASAVRWGWRTIGRGFSAAGRGLVSATRWGRGKKGKALRGIGSRRALGGVAALVVVFGLGIGVSQMWLSSGSDDDSSDRRNDEPHAGSDGTAAATPVDSGAGPKPDPEPAATPPTTATATAVATPTVSQAGPDPTTTPSATATATPPPVPTPVFVVLEQEPPSFERALEMATILAPDVSVPSDCLSPLPHPALLPNSPRNYRSGIHQGADFRCFARGHPAVAALDGRVVVAVGNYDDPDPAERTRLLDIAAQLGATPPYTLLTLYGNYVVVDHGVIPDVGHVVSIYAHLEEVAPDVRVGRLVEAGHELGIIGNRGTHAAANGDFYDDPHLHWELHIDNQFLGAGLSTDETRAVYTALLGPTSG